MGHHIRPEPGDIGVVEHAALFNQYVVVKVVKVTPSRLQISVLQPDGEWGEPRYRSIKQFMFMRNGLTREELLAVRQGLIDAATATRKAIAAAEERCKSLALMMAAAGEPMEY